MIRKALALCLALVAVPVGYLPLLSRLNLSQILQITR